MHPDLMLRRLDCSESVLSRVETCTCPVKMWGSGETVLSLRRFLFGERSSNPSSWVRFRDGMIEEMVVVIGVRGGGLGERSGDIESRPLEPEVDSGLDAGESEMVIQSTSASTEKGGVRGPLRLSKCIEAYRRRRCKVRVVLSWPRPILH
jgi:hypothetical protein